MEDYLLETSKTENDNTIAVNLLVEAHIISKKITKGQETMWADFTITWEKKGSEYWRERIGIDEWRK